MSDLLADVLEAHGGLARWDRLTTVRAQVVSSGDLFAMPGFQVAEIGPWHEGDQVWRGPQVTFPAGHPSRNSRQQRFSFGEDNLLRRHDYHVDIAGGFAVAQYVYRIIDADGIRLPTVHRAFRRDAKNRPQPGLVMVSTDISDVRFR